MGIVGYANSSYAGDLKDRKSIMGYYFFLKGTIITWSSKRQQIVSASTFEAKYVVMRYGAREEI